MILKNLILQLKLQRRKGMNNALWTVIALVLFGFLLIVVLPLFGDSVNNAERAATEECPGWRSEMSDLAEGVDWC